VAGVEPGIARYDSDTGDKRGGIPVKDVCLAMDVGFGSIWAASCTTANPTLNRVDTKTGRLTARIKLPEVPAEESSVGVDDSHVWVLTEKAPRHLMLIDPGSNRVLRQVPAPSNAAAVRGGLGALWVSTTEPPSVVRLDPRTAKPTATIRVGWGASFMAVGPDAVWVLSQDDGTVSRIDPTSNRVAATIKVTSATVQGGDIAATARAVWVRVSDDALAVRIDPATDTITERLGPAAGSGGVAIAEGSTWITSHDTTSLWRLPQP
jgi:hypothetical protein